MKLHISSKFAISAPVVESLFIKQVIEQDLVDISQ
jgi:hypothetical protein